MQINVDPNYIFPTLFIVGGRAANLQAPPAEPVGALIVKITVMPSGAIAQQQPILTNDESFVGDTRDEEDRTLRLESDLLPYKPYVDVVVAHDDWLRLDFGSVRINRGGGTGSWQLLPYHWRNRSKHPRRGEAGDAESFRPTVIDPANPPPPAEIYALPNGFRNRYFNGSHLVNQQPLHAGDSVDFDNGSTNRTVTIPTGPTIIFNNAPPLPLEQAVDTVVWDESNHCFLITWRSIFPWDDSLSNTSMEIS